MLRKKRCRGGTSLEMLICLPFVLVCIQCMIFLYTASLARHRTYAALPEVGRRAAREDQRVSGFRPSDDSKCSINWRSTARGHSLTGAEQSACRQAQYTPPRELMRVKFAAETEHKGLQVPGVTGTTYTRSPFSEAYLADR